MVDVTPESSSSNFGKSGRLLALTAGGLVVVLLLAYVAAFTWVGGGIPRGTTVAGVAIGGLSDTEAVQTLDDELSDRAVAMTVDVQGSVREYPAERLGIAFDPLATVAAIPRREAAPQALAMQVAGQDIEPDVQVDEAQLDRAVRSMARRVDDPVRQPRIEYDGLSVVVIEPRSGNELDRDLAASTIVDEYLTGDGPVTLVVAPVVPEVSVDEVALFAATEAEEAIARPVTLSMGRTNVRVSPLHIAAALSYRGQGGAMQPEIDVPVLRELLAAPLDDVGSPAVDATFSLASGSPKVVKSRTGRGVDDDALRVGMIEALASPTRTAQLGLEKSEPELTTAEARRLGIREVISTFTQEFPYAAYRVTNIGVAANAINGTVLEPGETFSLNGVVGERTPENGFVEGFVIQNGRLVEDYGGAVSTITTAMWHTAFFAGMTRLEQRAHSYWISRYTAGLEATVSWGSLDLKYRNDTPYGVLITSSVTDTSVTTTMWSTKYWDIDAVFGPRENPRTPGTIYDTTDACVPQVGVDGFDITVVRVWKRSGEVERREPLRTSYNAASTVICAPDPAEQNDPKKPDKPNDKPGNDPGGGGGGSGGSGGGSGGSGGNNN
ncbi:MAG: VanW family protein [Actinomycetes bacterium]